MWTRQGGGGAATSLTACVPCPCSPLLRDGAEQLSVDRALRALSRAEVAVIVLDGAEGVTQQVRVQRRGSMRQRRMDQALSWPGLAHTHTPTHPPCTHSPHHTAGLSPV